MDQKTLDGLVIAWIITSKQAQKITEYETTHMTPVAKEKQWGFQNSLFTIGSILIWLGIMSFVWFNRSYIDDILKIVIFVAFTGATYGIGYYLKYTRNIKILWGSLLFISGLSVWATIFLIAQIYNMTVTSDILLLIWIALILPLVYLLQQKEFYYLYMLLISSVLWIFFVSHEYLITGWRNMIVLYQLFGAIILMIWYIHDRTSTEPLLNKLYKIFWLKLFTLAYFVLLVATQFRDTDVYILSNFIIWLFIFVIAAFFALWAIQKKNELLFGGAATILFLTWILFNEIYLLNDIFFIIFALWVCYFGYTNNNSSVIRSWNLYLYGFLVYIYIRHWYGYINNFIFFLIGWILLIILWVFYKRINTGLKAIFSSLSDTWKKST